MLLGINIKKKLALIQNIVFKLNQPLRGATFKGEIDMKDLLGACILGAILGAMIALSI